MRTTSHSCLKGGASCWAREQAGTLESPERREQPASLRPRRCHHDNGTRPGCSLQAREPRPPCACGGHGLLRRSEIRVVSKWTREHRILGLKTALSTTTFSKGHWDLWITDNISLGSASSNITTYCISSFEIFLEYSSWFLIKLWSGQILFLQL